MCLGFPRGLGGEGKNRELALMFCQLLACDGVCWMGRGGAGATLYLLCWGVTDSWCVGHRGIKGASVFVGP